MRCQGLPVLLLTNDLLKLILIFLEVHDLELEFADLSLVPVQGLDGLGVALQYKQLLLELMILLVEEFDLIREFPDCALIRLVRVLN